MRKHIPSIAVYALFFGLALLIGAPLIERVNHREVYKEKVALSLWAAQTGTWWWDMEEGHLFWDARTFDIFGQDLDTWVPGYASFEDMLHPDDRGWVAEKVRRTVRDGSRFHCQYRVIDPEGRLRIIEARGSVDGDKRYFAGTVHLVDRDPEGWETRSRQEMKHLPNMPVGPSLRGLR